MDKYLIDLIRKYKNKGILIDANLLLLLCIGSVDENLIPNFKRTKKYRIKDFALLNEFLSNFKLIITTPNILTEVSNLANCIREDLKPKFGFILSKYIQKLDEKYLKSKDISNTKDFIIFGLTDAIILNMIKNEYLLFTDDLKLSHYAQKKEIDVINFEHIRWQF